MCKANKEVIACVIKIIVYDDKRNEFVKTILFA